MKYTLYKPNSKNNGCAMSFEIGTLRDGGVALFVSAVLQSSWNDNSKTGSFKENAKNPKKSITIKLNANEAGELLSSLKTRIPYATFHKNNDDSTSIKFTPWDKPRTIKGKDENLTYDSDAFGLSIVKNSALTFKIALEAGETEVLAVLLKEFIAQVLYAAKEEFRPDNKQNDKNQNDDDFGLDNQSSNSKNSQSEEVDDNDVDDDVPF